MEKKLILIDGNAIFHRAYHSTPPFQTSSGEFTNAVYGFVRMLFDVYLKQRPDYLGIAWDMSKKTFRSEEFSEYKAHRPPPPPNLYEQLPRLKQIVKAFHIPQFELEGYEADDLLGTLSLLAEQESDLKTIILTGDRDALQLVSEKVNVLVPLKGISETKLFTPEEVKNTYGITPEQMIDYKGLCGDSSDNLPGIQGIGPKTAVALIQKYHTFENILSHCEELPPAQAKKIRENLENGIMSKKLATIIRNIPLNFDLEEYRTTSINYEEIKGLFEALEFKTLLKKLFDLEKQYKNIHSQQTSLF